MTEIAAILTVACKLSILENLLDKRIMRAAMDTVSPTLPLMDKVYKLGEYKRLCVNLAVMEHRIRCALGDEDTNIIAYAALKRFGLDYKNKRVKRAVKSATCTLGGLGIKVSDLQQYKALPLYRAECNRLKKIYESKPSGEVILASAEQYACSRVGRTAQAL